MESIYKLSDVDDYDCIIMDEWTLRLVTLGIEDKIKLLYDSSFSNEELLAQANRIKPST